MALPQLNEVLSDSAYADADPARKQEISDAYWKAYRTENPDDGEWADAQQKALNEVISTRKELADATPFEQRSLQLRLDAANNALKVGNAGRLGYSKEQVIDLWQSGAEDIKSRVEQLNRSVSLFKEDNADKLSDLREKAKNGGVFGASPIRPSGGVPGEVASGVFKNIRENKSAYQSSRDKLSEEYGVEPEVIDSVVQHQLGQQPKAVSRDALGQFHLKDEVLVGGADVLLRSIVDSDLPTSVKVKLNAEAPARLALFQKNLIESVKKDHPELASEIKWTGDVSKDYQALDSVLNENRKQQLGGGFAEYGLNRAKQAARGLALSSNLPLSHGPGSRSVRAPLSENQQAAITQPVERAQKLQESVNQLSDYINQEKVRILGTNAATVASGVASGIESIALGAVTGGLGNAVISADRIKKAGTFGKVVLGGLQRGLNTTPIATIYGADQALRTYEQTGDIGLSALSGAIEGGITTFFGTVKLGGLEDIGSRLATPAARRAAGKSVARAWAGFGGSLVKDVTNEQLEELTITALDTLYVQSRINPGMTSDDLKKSLYDTVVSTLFAIGPGATLSATREQGTNLFRSTTDQNTEQLHAQADRIQEQATAETNLPETETTGGTDTEGGAPGVAPRERMTRNELREAVDDRVAELEAVPEDQRDADQQTELQVLKESTLDEVAKERGVEVVESSEDERKRLLKRKAEIESELGPEDVVDPADPTKRLFSRIPTREESQINKRLGELDLKEARNADSTERTPEQVAEEGQRFLDERQQQRETATSTVPEQTVSEQRGVESVEPTDTENQDQRQVLTTFEEDVAMADRPLSGIKQLPVEERQPATSERMAAAKRVFATLQEGDVVEDDEGNQHTVVSVMHGLDAVVFEDSKGVHEKAHIMFASDVGRDANDNLVHIPSWKIVKRADPEVAAKRDARRAARKAQKAQSPPAQTLSTPDTGTTTETVPNEGHATESGVEQTLPEPGQRVPADSTSFATQAPVGTVLQAETGTVSKRPDGTWRYDDETDDNATADIGRMPVVSYPEAPADAASLAPLQDINAPEELVGALADIMGIPRDKVQVETAGTQGELVQGELFQNPEAQGNPAASAYVRSFKGSPPTGASRAIIDYAGDPLLRNVDDLPAQTRKDIEEADQLIQQATGKKGRVKVGRVRFNDFLFKLWKRHHRGKKPGWQNFQDRRGIRQLGRVVAFEIAHALSKDGSGVDWYRGKIDQMYQTLSSAFPELSDPESKGRFFFSIILAATSNGQPVLDNLTDAIRIYRNNRNADLLPTKVRIRRSERSAAVNASLRDANFLIRQHGWEKAKQMMLEPVTVSQLKSEYGVDLHGERADHTVIGAMLMGPKIGSFWGNLNGHYDSITMDLWFTRSMNRLSGDTATINPSAITTHLEALDKLPGIPLNVKKDIKSFLAALKAGEGWTRIPSDIREEVEALYDFAKTTNNRYSSSGYKDRSPINKTVQKFLKELDGGEDAPDNGTHRKWMRDVIGAAQEQLKKAGVEISNADLQAVLWFHEKDLYTRFGATSSRGERADYASAAEPALGRNFGEGTGNDPGSSPGVAGPTGPAAAGTASLGFLDEVPRETKRQMEERLRREREGTDTLYQFAGEGAVIPQFMRDSLDTARSMAAAGKSSEEIRAVTGWFPGKYDGKMRWEIPDEGASLQLADYREKRQAGEEPQDIVRKFFFEKQAREEEAAMEEASDLEGEALFAFSDKFESAKRADNIGLNTFYWNTSNVERGRVPLGYLLDHEALYEAYPALKWLPVSFSAQDLGGADPTITTGAYGDGVIFVNPVAGFANPEALQSTLLHEIQHWIQEQEGFGRGSNVQMAAREIASQDAAVQRAQEKAREAEAAYQSAKEEAVAEIVAERGKPSPLDSALADLRPEVKAAAEAWAKAKAEADFKQPVLATGRVERKDAFSRYRATAGEIEARDIQARASFTSEQRAAIAPYSSENIAPESAIVLYQNQDQGPKGQVTFKDTAQALITLFKSSDQSTAIHEMAHVARRFLFNRDIPQENRLGITDEDIDTAEKWAGVKDGVWDRNAEEKFARGFERYIRDGKFPENSALQELFQKMSQWLKAIYQTVSNSSLNVQISPEMRQVFDKLVTRGERIANQTPAAPKPAPAKKRLPPSTTTSLKNATTDRTLRENGMEPILGPARQSNEETWERSMAVVSKNPELGAEIVRDIQRDGRSVRDEVEEGVLLHELASRKAAVARARNRVNRSEPGSEEQKAAQRSMEEAEAELYAAIVAAKLAGTAWGRIGQFRQRFINEDFSLEAMESRFRADVLGGAPLSAADRAYVAEMQKKITEAEEARKQLEQRVGELERQAAAYLEKERAKLGVEAAKVRKPPKEKQGDFTRMIKQKAQAARSILDRFRSLKQEPETLRQDEEMSPEELEAFAAIGAEYLLDGHKDFVAFSKKLSNEFPGAMPYVRAVFNAAQKSFRGSSNSSRTKTPIELFNTLDIDSPEIDAKLVYRMARGFINQGYEDTDVLDAVTELLQEKQPDLTREEVVILFTNYGKVKYPSQEEDLKKLRDLRNIERILAQIEDVKSGQLPKKTGQQRDPASLRVRELMKELKQAMKDAGLKHAVNKGQLRGSLDAIKSRFKNEIEELEKAIATKTPRTRERSQIEYDEETNALKKRRDELKEKYNQIFGPKKRTVSDQQRLKNAHKYLTKMIAEEEAMLRQGILKRVKQNKALVLTPELQALRDKLDSMREARHAAYEALHPKKTPEQRAIERAVNEARKSIARYEEILRTQQLPDKRQRQALPADQALTMLLNQRNTLKKAVDALRKAQRPRQSKEQRRMKAAESQLRRALAEVDRRIKTGDFAPKAKNKVSSPAIDSLRAQLKAQRAVLKALMDTGKPQLTPEEQRDQALIKASERRRAKIEARIKAGDYVKTKRIVRKESAALAAARLAEAKAKEEWNRGFFEAKLKNRSVTVKLADGVAQTFNLARTLKTIADVSAVLRQGAAVFFSRPWMSVKAIPEMFLAGLSEVQDQRIRSDIESSKYYHLSQQAKLFLSHTGPDDTQAKVEEAFRGRWARQIPGLNKVVNFSERTYNAYLNKVRIGHFEALVNAAGGDTVTVKEARIIADFVNKATGRGNLRSAENSAAALATIFFSPKFVVSRFQLIAGVVPATFDLVTGAALRSADVRRAKRAIAKEYARMIFGIASVYTLDAMAKSLYGDDDEEWMEIDPRSSKFGRIRIGNTYIDPMGGMLQAATFLARMTPHWHEGEFGVWTKTGAGEVVTLRRPGFGKQSYKGVLGRFLQSKLSPIPATAIELFQGEDVVGNVTTPTSGAISLFPPLVVGDIWDIMKEDNKAAGVPLSVLVAFGLGVQVRNDENLSFEQEAAVKLYDLTGGRIGDERSVFDKKTGKKTKYRYITR